MIIRDSWGSKNNSIAFNPLTDDLNTINYLALAYCIAGFKTANGIQYPGISKSCSALGLYEQQERKKPVRNTKGIPNLKKRIKVKAINVITGEEKEFLGTVEAGNYTKVSKETVSYHLRSVKKSETKQGWRFEYAK